jgi:hypothetical protein
MASVVYNEFKRAMLAAWLADADVRIRLVMSNTTCGTENDGIVNIADFTTVDVCDGTNYVDKTLASETATKDDANDRAEYDAADVTWTALGAGTRETVGVLLMDYVDGTDGNDKVVQYLEFASPVTHDGTDFTISWNAEGNLWVA